MGWIQEKITEICTDVFTDNKGTKPIINKEKGLIAFVGLFHDEISANPLADCDGLGKIHSFDKKDINFISKEEFEKTIRGVPKEAVIPLSYFEHGSCLWFPRKNRQTRESVAGDFYWDGTDVKGVWIADKYLLECAEDSAKAAEQSLEEFFLDNATKACDLYTKWCNGEIYMLSLEVFKIRKAPSDKEEKEQFFDQYLDYRFDEPLFETCHGGLTYEDVQIEAPSVAMEAEEEIKDIE